MIGAIAKISGLSTAQRTAAIDKMTVESPVIRPVPDAEKPPR